MLSRKQKLTQKKILTSAIRFFVKKQKLHQVFDSFNSKKVLVIGDVMIDAYLLGKVERISPEAPVPVLAAQERENRLGGAANVALNVQALGATPVLCSVVGKDDKSRIFFELLQKRGMTAEGILASTERITTTKTRVISGDQHLLRVDSEITQELSPQLATQFAEHIAQIVESQRIDAIIFEDYDKGVITAPLIEKVVRLATEKQIPTLVDPKKRHFLSYKKVTLFKPNFKELVEGLKLDIGKGDFQGIGKAAQILHRDYQISYVLTTLSELGVFVSYNGSYHRQPAEVRHIADVSGAGDTVISIAALCLSAGLAPVEIATIANLGGGLVCEKVGVVPIDKQQLLAECEESFVVEAE